MSVKVKICGITNLDDAQAAVEAGADALGFVFWGKSLRAIDPVRAAAITYKLPPHVLRTGVFVDPPEDLVLEAITRCGLNLLQFHGDEPAEFCLKFRVMSMKAFRVRGPETIEALDNYPTDAWLLDAYTPGQQGGTGESFNWELARRAIGRGRPVFLAGGLTPQNVAEAIRVANPFGVDVSSGVEEKPGKKDPAKVRAFIKAAKSAG